MWSWGKTAKEDVGIPEDDSFNGEFTGIGIIDESLIIVHESDLNDPQLLSELNDLKNDEDDLISFDDVEKSDEVNIVEGKNTVVRDESDILSLKQRAVALKKEGRKSEALDVLKEVKRLQNISEPSEKQSLGSLQTVKTDRQNPPVLKSELDSKMETNTMVSSTSRKQPGIEQHIAPQVNNRSFVNVPSQKSPAQAKLDPPLDSFPYSAGNDQFTPLENAINEAMKSLLLEAKELKESQPHKAAEKFRKYKSLKDELLVLASRRAIPGALPPLFRWSTISKETIIEDSTLGDDQLKLRIQSINDLEAVLQDHSSRTLSLSYNVGVVKDNPEYKTKQVRYKTSERSAEFLEENIFTFRRKGSTIESQFSRKKITFTLILHRGMFHADKILGTAKLNLSDLLTKCKAGGFLQLLDPSGKKTIGGRLEVYAMLRRPISNPEILLETERELVIQEWPSVLQQSFQPPPLEAIPVSIPQANEPPPLQPAANQSAIDFTLLSDLEKDDPLNTNFIVSNDVLESEISSTEASIASCRDPDVISDLQIRLMLLQGKLAVLVNQVQNETLTFEDYIDSVKQRLESDKRLAVYCNQSNRKAEAVQLMKRIRIMQSEILSAEQGPGEDP
jgi:rhodanese-related sulfurtransferase